MSMKVPRTPEHIKSSDDQRTQEQTEEGRPSHMNSNRSDDNPSNPNSGDELIHADSGKKLTNDPNKFAKNLSPKKYDSYDDIDHDLEFYDKIQNMRHPAGRTDMTTLNQQIEFKDFLEPNVIKTGHIIPTQSGHNGHLSVTELVLYEIHLNNAGLLNNYQTEQQVLEAQNRALAGQDLM